MDGFSKSQATIVTGSGEADDVTAELILIVDDMPENLGLLGESLSNAGYAVRVANSGAAALRHACQPPIPDLILLDVMMPEMDGYEVLVRLREDERTREIPVIFLTAMDDARDVVRGLRLGAADYITKPIQPEVLLARVRSQIETARARTWLRDQNAYLESEIARRMADIRRYVDEIERKSNFDDLTGLPNRNLLNDRLAHALDRLRNTDRTLAVLSLGIDRFKSINESLGHGAGDAVLRETGRRLGEAAHKIDTLARVEGDTFVVIAEASADEAAEQIARPMLMALAATFDVAGRGFHLSASVGIAVFPKDGSNGEDLLKNADAARLRAKTAGGNAVNFYAPAMTARSLERLDMENGLRRAIEQDELVLHYQPQVNLRTGAIVGAEALVRWQHPERGLIGPNDFIPLAEESGLIAPLGEWVLQSACRQNKAWQDGGLPAISVAVNLSARQFELQDVVAMTRAVLQETGLAANYLELELTESAIMSDADAFIGATRALKDLSVNLSIDDFGTGYSSLSYLKRFAVDRLKIDQAFVRDITHDPNSAAIALAIISLAHTLKLSVIGEGVETEGQLRFLRNHDCDEMQGYYFAKPLPTAEFGQWLRDSRTLSFPAAADLPQRTLLIVDDDHGIMSSLKRLFRREGYILLTAENGLDGLEVLARNAVGVVISDGRMPVMTGAEFLGKVRQMYPDPVRMMLSGYTDLQAVTSAVNRGELFRFLLKPWDDAELLETVREAFRYYEARHPREAMDEAGDHGHG